MRVNDPKRENMSEMQHSYVPFTTSFSAFKIPQNAKDQREKIIAISYISLGYRTKPLTINAMLPQCPYQYQYQYQTLITININIT